MAFFDSLRPEKWAHLATALGLTPFRPVETYSQDMCFRRLERARGKPADGEASFELWLWGKYRGLDVAVLQYETGSGSSATTWTSALVRIDPPLWLGLEVTGEGFFTKLFGGDDIQVGHAVADRELRIESFDPARARALLSPQDEVGRGLLQSMIHLAGSLDLMVADSLVRVARNGIYADPPEVVAMLEPACNLAAWLAARRRALPISPAEQAHRLEWQRFADANGFRFDPERMSFGGTREGTLLEVALEVEGQQAFTALSARFPSAVPVVFHLTRTNTPGFLQGVFSQDIDVGEPVFDRAYKVVGHPEEAVRQLLRRPGLLGALNYAASLSMDVRIGQQGLFLRVGGPGLPASHLETLVGWACAVSRELTGGTTTPGPYR